MNKQWKVSGSESTTAIWVEDESGQRVCTLRNCEMDLDRANLIAAAPDLLEALQEFEIEECPRCSGTGKDADDKKSACTRCAGSGEILRGGWPAHVRAAISRATGES